MRRRLREGYPGGVAPNLLTAIRQGETFRALRNRNYRLLWIGQVGHSASLWVETIARSWLIWELTGSAILLAVVNMLRAIPMLLLGLFAGAIADRFDKRKLLIICKIFTLVNKLVLAVLITTGAIEVWHVLLGAFLMGCSMAFEQPTRTALIPSLVGKDELLNAIALNSVATDISRVVGPGIAGALIGPLGIDGVYYTSSAVYVVTLIATIMLQVPPVIAREGRISLWGDVGEGLHFVWKEKVIFVLMVLALIPMLFGQPYMTIMPIFADRVLHAGASGYGWLQSASGGGALLVVLLIATMPRIPQRGFFILFTTFGFGALLVAFSQTTLLLLALVLILFVGFASTAPRIVINTRILELTPPQMYGRVMAVYHLDRGLVPLGTIAVGLLADAIGVSSTFLIMGSVLMLLALSVGIGVPFVRRIS